MKLQTEQSQPNRIIFRTPEFDAFYNLLPSKVKEKFEYVFNVVQSVRNVSTKFVKHLQSAKDLYEMRISVGTNEYRTILFAIDHDNVIESTRIILLNGFLKKSTKDYKKQIEIAHKIFKQIPIMIQLDENKLAKLPTTNQMLDEKFGVDGTQEREEFNAKALAWYYGTLLRDRRRELKLTQRQVAEKIGREQTYIARIERGKADIQLSSFFRIAAVLGIQFIPTFIK